MATCHQCKEQYHKGGVAKGALLHYSENEMVEFCGAACCQEWMKANAKDRQPIFNIPRRKK